MVKNFETVLEPFDKMFGPMHQAYLTAKNMVSIRAVDPEYLKAFHRVRETFFVFDYFIKGY